MKKLSIGMRLTLWSLAIFVVAQIIFGAGLWFLLQHQLYDLVDDSLESQIDDLKNFFAAQKKDAGIAQLQAEVAETYALEHSGDYLEIHAENGALLYRSTFLRQHPQMVSGKPVGQAGTRDVEVGGQHLRFLEQTIEAHGHVYRVTTGVGSDDVVETLSLLRSSLLAIAPLIFLLAAAGGYWLSRRALSPVDVLVRTARQISGANLSSRLQKLETGDELQRLSDTLNEMLARIEAAFLRITEFTADASHELRTPVSLIRTEAEVALRRPRGEAEYQESLRHILLEAERTTSLIEKLLALARADSGREMLHLQPVDLRETLGEVVESWRQVAAIRNLKFSANFPAQDCLVMGDEPALRRVADILLDNAFKYTPPPGSVELSLGHAGESLVIAIRDSGVGIAEEDRKKIFERFYRVDKARSREMGGAGLGLAIAQWIVAQHLGSITVESEGGRGSTFRVELPMIAATIRNEQPA